MLFANVCPRSMTISCSRIKIVEKENTVFTLNLREQTHLHILGLSISIQLEIVAIKTYQIRVGANVDVINTLENK